MPLARQPQILQQKQKLWLHPIFSKIFFFNPQETLRISRNSCGVCMQSLKTSQGMAIHTAECSHTFRLPEVKFIHTLEANEEKGSANESLRISVTIISIRLFSVTRKKFVLSIDEPSNEIVIWDALTTEEVARWAFNHIVSPRWLEHSPVDTVFVMCGTDRSVRQSSEIPTLAIQDSMNQSWEVVDLEKTVEEKRCQVLVSPLPLPSSEASKKESVRSLLSLLDEKPPSHYFSCQLEYVHYLTGLEKHETILTPLHAPGDKKTNVLDFLTAEFAEMINREMVQTAIGDPWHIIKFQGSTSSNDLCHIAAKNGILLKPINTLHSLNEATRLASVAGGSRLFSVTRKKFVLSIDEPSNEIVIWDALTTEEVARWAFNHIVSPRGLEHSPVDAVFVMCGTDRSDFAGKDRIPATQNGVLLKEMVPLLNSTSINHTLFPNASTQLGLYRHGQFRRNIIFYVRSEQVPSASNSPCQDSLGRRQLLAAGVTIAPWFLLSRHTTSFAAETKKGFLSVTDKKDGYTFVYPFGWQEVVVEGQDKVFKDVIEPLESVSVNLLPTSKTDIRDFGPPQQIAETLIKKVLASPSQKTKLIEASEHDVDGRAYYTFEFVAKAPNYTRHALSTICIGNGKFYTLTTGANERRWEKMKDRLKTVVDSFQIFSV
ncbi:unnamed protein product [Fraxinus pennsylvanica]|uniref:C2H2-type domain-containing protein n=1 Tax=Fraxinus pennsylvanica TaxID=56036 RepID=A0AAD2EF82_9LAMI|nr:unnamed protein product [Fraxinus pennsylvanica]